LGGTAAIPIGTTVGGVDEKIRSTIGLDKFAIETGFSQTTQTMEPRFVVGKSFGDRVSISASQSVGTSAYHLRFRGAEAQGGCLPARDLEAAPPIPKGKSAAT